MDRDEVRAVVLAVHKKRRPNTPLSTQIALYEDIVDAIMERLDVRSLDEILESEKAQALADAKVHLDRAENIGLIIDAIADRKENNTWKSHT